MIPVLIIVVAILGVLAIVSADYSQFERPREAFWVFVTSSVTILLFYAALFLP